VDTEGEAGARAGPHGTTEEAFMTFDSEVKQIEKRDLVLTSKNRIGRSTVLQIDPEVTDEKIKKRLRQLSILLLLDQEQKKMVLDIIQAGKEFVEQCERVKKKKKQLNKEGKPTSLAEDDPELFKQAVYIQTMKLFAEQEIKRKEREAKEMHERKRQREEDMEAQEKRQKNFEESRDGRVDSWRNFQANTKGKKGNKNQTFLRPPKVKMEPRE
uniref:Uncharacterized protein n=1 Tax=Macaca nemestrina TaxID=9545 RepID=A0A2K6BNT0_MACNE